jgi:hypothetical protein
MITFTPEQLAKAERMLGHLPGEVVKALTRAINRAADAARAEAVRGATARYRVQASAIRKTMTIHRAAGNQPAAAISSTGNRIALHKFRVVPNDPAYGKRRTRPHKAAVLKANAPKAVPGMFVARMKNGHIGAFSREGKKRLPIREHFGPSIPEMLGQESVIRLIENRATEMLESRLEREIDFILSGGGK